MNQSQFQSKLSEYKKLIDDEILAHSEHINSRTLQIYGQNSILASQVYTNILNRGGKRLRGALTIVGYQMCGGKDMKMIVKAAMAIEMMHAYILMIDDIQDRSTLRRGGPSAHKLFEKIHTEQNWSGNAEHTSLSLTLNAALNGLHSAGLVFGMLDVAPELRVKALNIMNHTMNVTLHGQTNDIVNQVSSNVSEEMVDNVLQWKTAHYTFLNPIHMGMVLAGAGCEDTNAITEYALNAGKAFQIKDDLLIVSRDKSKNAIDDIREGKRTILVQYSLKNASSKDREFLLESLGNDRLTNSDFKRCQEILVKSGAVKYAQARLDSLIDKANSSLNEHKDLWSHSSVCFLKELSSLLK